MLASIYKARSREIRPIVIRSKNLERLDQVHNRGESPKNHFCWGSGHHIVVDIDGSFSRLALVGGLSSCFELDSKVGLVETTRWVRVAASEGETRRGQVVGVSRVVGR